MQKRQIKIDGKNYNSLQNGVSQIGSVFHSKVNTYQNKLIQKGAKIYGIQDANEKFLNKKYKHFDSDKLVFLPLGQETGLIDMYYPSGNVNFQRASQSSQFGPNGFEIVPANQPAFDINQETKEFEGMNLSPEVTNFFPDNTNIFSSKANFKYFQGDASIVEKKFSIYQNPIKCIKKQNLGAEETFTYIRDEFKAVVPENGQYCLSCLISTEDNSVPVPSIESNGGTFNFINNNDIAKIIKLASDVYLMYSIRNLTENTLIELRINKYSGNNTTTFYEWGYQLNAGNFPYRILPTTGTIVTKLADEISSITVPNNTTEITQEYKDETTLVTEIPENYTPPFGNVKSISMR